MKKLSIKIAIFTLFLGVTGLLAYKQLTKPEKSAYINDISAQFKGADMDVRDFYFDRFNQKEQELNKALASRVDIEQCKKDQNTMFQDFKVYVFETYGHKNRKNITHTTLNLIDIVARDFDINSDEFVILTDTRPIPATMQGCILYVNEDLLNSYSEKSQKFVIAHEFAHMIYDDGSLITVLENHLNLDNEYDCNLLDKISRFQEARADIFASTKNIDYAQGGLEFFNMLYERHGDPLITSHPQTSERITAHNTIVALHTNNQTLA
jgi:hypothetical protein